MAESSLRPMQELIHEFTEHRVWAVVGVSHSPSKYGNRVFRDLRRAGYVVYGVNPKGGVVEGEALYRSLDELPEFPAVVDLVVPPAVTEQVVKELDRLGLRPVWMQPGAESDAAVQYCHEHDIDVVHDACAMVHKRQWP